MDPVSKYHLLKKDLIVQMNPFYSDVRLSLTMHSEIKNHVRENTANGTFKLTMSRYRNSSYG